MIGRSCLVAVILWMAVTFSCLSTALWAEPCVRLSYASPHDLDGLVTYATEIGKSPGKAQDLREFLNKMGLGDGGGLDTTKRWGVAVELGQANQLPTIVALFPVKNEQAFLAGLKPFFPQQEKLQDGRHKLQGPAGPPMALRFAESYAQITMLTPNEVPAMKDVAKVLEGQRTVELGLVLGSNPAQTKKSLLETARLLTARWLQQQNLSDDTQRKAAQAKIDEMMGQLETKLATLGDVKGALDLSPNRHELRLSLDNPGPTVATTQTAAASIGLARLAPDSAPIALAADVVLPGGASFERGSMVDAFKVGLSKASLKEADLQQLAVALDSELWALTKTLRIEGSMFLDGKQGALNLVAATRLAKDSKLPAIILPKAEEFAKASNGKLTSVTVDGARVNTITLDAKGLPTERFGAAEASWGQIGEVFWLVIGPKSADRIKALSSSLPKTPGASKETDSGAKGWISVRSMLDLFGEGELAPGSLKRQVLDVLLTPNADQVRFSANLRGMDLAIQEGILAVLLKSAFESGAAGAAGGTPSGPPSVPSVGDVPPVAPSASTSEVPPTAPSPAPTPEAKPEPSSEGGPEGNSENDNNQETTPER